MADDYRIELYKQHRDAQNQYAYFLLAASGAAIAFAVTQTGEAALSWSMLPLGAAVAAWGLSFFCGCRHLTYVESFLHSNMELFRVQRGEHPEVGGHPHMIQAASDGVRLGMEKKVELAARYARNQFRLLIAGAVFFILWHIIAMASRIPPAPSS